MDSIQVKVPCTVKAKLTEKLKKRIIEGTLERTAELKVGSNMRELMNVEVLVEDDKVVAIRG